MQNEKEPRLYGPFGWLNGCRALNEESWELESDPLESSDEYFAIPLFAKVDPFAESGRSAPSAFDAAVMPAPDARIQLHSGQIQPAIFFYAIEGQNLYHIAIEHGFDCQFGEMLGGHASFEEDEAQEAAYEADPDGLLSAWEPSVPEGWKFAGKWHGEDGPVSCFLRKREAGQ